MDAVVPFYRRPAFHTFLRFVHDRNPFYLLSALCLFTGFRVILGALNSAPGDWKTLLELILTLNVYEVVTIALALFLIIRRGLQRDGWILLGIEALFLVDLTNLNAELFTAMPKLGAVVNAMLFAVAMAKILIITRALGLRLSPTTRFYIAAQMAFLLGLPGIFRLMRSSTAAVSAWQIYSVWWMVGLLIAAGAFFVQRARPSQPTSMQALPWRLYILLPLISLLVHLCGQNRVYWVHFQPANIAPVLLALVFAMNRSRLRWHVLAFPVSLAMVVISVLISITPDGYQHELSRVVLGSIVTPLRIALFGSTAVTAFLAVTHYSLIAAVASASCMILAGLGSDPIDMYYRTIAIARWTVRAGRRLIPETAAAWGTLAIAGAFLLLGAGALVSLKAPRAAVSDEENPVSV